MAAERQIPGGRYVNETGTRQAQIPGGEYVNETVSGGVTDFEATGSLVAGSAVIAGTGIDGRTSTGSLLAQEAVIAGSAIVGRTSTGSLVAGSALIDGSATFNGAADFEATGALLADVASISGDAVRGFAATGSLVAQSAVLAGTGTVGRTSTGSLIAGSALISGTATVVSSSSGPSESHTQEKRRSIDWSIPFVVHKEELENLEQKVVTLQAEIKDTKAQVDDTQNIYALNALTSRLEIAEELLQQLLIQREQLRKVVNREVKPSLARKAAKEFDIWVKKQEEDRKRILVLEQEKKVEQILRIVDLFDEEEYVEVKVYRLRKRD